MIVNHENHDGYFYVKNPHIDAQRRLTFSSRNCTHYLIVSGTIGDEMDIRKNGVLERLPEIRAAQNSGDTFSIGKYRVRLVRQSTYIAAGNHVQMDTKSSCHSVYGCIFTEADDRLDICIPEKAEESVVYIPLKVKYQIRPQKTEEKKGFLGIGRKEAEFSGYYVVRVDDIQEYQDGCIYYTLNGFTYYLSKEMLGKYIYIKADRSRSEPELCSASKSINLVRIQGGVAQ